MYCVIHPVSSSGHFRWAIGRNCWEKFELGRGKERESKRVRGRAMIDEYEREVSLRKENVTPLTFASIQFNFIVYCIEASNIITLSVLQFGLVMLLLHFLHAVWRLVASVLFCWNAFWVNSSINLKRVMQKLCSFWTLELPPVFAFVQVHHIGSRTLPNSFVMQRRKMIASTYLYRK